MRGHILPVDWTTLVTVNVGINTNGRVRGATNNFLNGYNYSSQPEPSFCRNSFGIYEGVVETLRVCFMFFILLREGEMKDVI